jgi:hypothetical protein
MTSDHKLKKAIRARAKKTGESYAAARRQYLKPAPATPAPSPKDAEAKAGGMTEASAQRATGHGLEHWFAVLDAFSPGGAAGHTAAARHLADGHRVPGWHAQGITVAWERSRGHRAMNQSCTGTFNVSVSRVLPAEVTTVTAALQDQRARRAWLASADPALARALAAALDGRQSKGLKQPREDRARLRFRWDDCTIELRIDGKPGGKASLVADNMELPEAAAVERRRAAWKDALDALKTYLSSPR